ncbi:hypothetical protein HQQ80_11425 [Microbacteriaceae bacterium VKM Ac-2855]|nr:hypothetical protein [Microbacteriaceae bacterium VKM Ac-2855]
MSEKNDGVGSENTIPDSEDGLAVGVGGASHFNPEEDEEAAADPDEADTASGGPAD